MSRGIYLYLSQGIKYIHRVTGIASLNAKYLSVGDFKDVSSTLIPRVDKDKPITYLQLKIFKVLSL